MRPAAILLWSVIGALFLGAHPGQAAGLTAIGGRVDLVGCPILVSGTDCGGTFRIGSLDGVLGDFCLAFNGGGNELPSPCTVDDGNGNAGSVPAHVTSPGCSQWTMTWDAPGTLVFAFTTGAVWKIDSGEIQASGYNRSLNQYAVEMTWHGTSKDPEGNVVERTWVLTGEINSGGPFSGACVSGFASENFDFAVTGEIA